MPQPAVNDATAQRLIDVYQRANDRLLAAYEQAVMDPDRFRQARRMRELIDTHEAIIDGLTEATRAWWTGSVPELHAAGAAYAAQVTGGTFAWSQPHVAAVEDFATRTWTDIATRLREIDTETRTVLRAQVRDATRAALLENRTAVQAGRDLAREAARQGLWSVEYGNGARHTMRDYADSVIRTTTAESYNRGSVVQTVEEGFTHVEYFDGEGCGVVSHNDPQQANGLIVPIGEVVYLAHPRCRRAVVPALPTGPLVTEAPDIGAPRPVEALPIRRREPRTPRTPRR